MIEPSQGDLVLITITGRDRPGVTAEIADLLSKEQARVLDIEQAVTQGHLTLHWLVDLDDGSEPVLKDLLWKARELEMQADFRIVPRAVAETPVDQRYAVTLVQAELSSQVIARATRAAAARGFNIAQIGRLSRGRLASLELILEGGPEADAQGLREDLVALEGEERCDVALQSEGLLRRSKRLVIMDMDSTLIRQEVIDELARAAGAYEEVAKVTERAMNGEIGFDESLRLRVAALEGVPTTVFAEVLERIELTPGAENLVKVLKRLGYRLAVISGGFMEVVEPLRQRLGLDYAFANRLEVKDGKLTGKVVGQVVNRQRKADLLESLAQTERIALDQVIAVGDGANDLDMLSRAGLGIAFNAKRTVQDQAEYSLNQQSLDTILYLLGIREDEVKDLL